LQQIPFASWKRKNLEIINLVRAYRIYNKKVADNVVDVYIGQPHHSN